MTQRYGDFVLTPARQADHHAAVVPARRVLIGGVIVLMLVLRRRSRLPDDRFEADVRSCPKTRRRASR